MDLFGRPVVEARPGELPRGGDIKFGSPDHYRRVRLERRREMEVTDELMGELYRKYGLKDADAVAEVLKHALPGYLVPFIAGSSVREMMPFSVGVRRFDVTVIFEIPRGEMSSLELSDHVEDAIALEDGHFATALILYAHPRQLIQIKPSVLAPLFRHENRDIRARAMRAASRLRSSRS